MSNDTEQVHNEYIDMTYLFKIYTNIAPTGNNISFTEKQNFSYGVLLGLITPGNIVITTQCSGWVYSSVFIKYQKSDKSHRDNDLPLSILHLVIKKHIPSRRPAVEYFFIVCCNPTKLLLSIVYLQPTEKDQ